MKNIILTILLSSIGLAHAEVIATQPNKANGKIVLTNEVCKAGGKTYDKLYKAYNYSGSGASTDGCFYLEDEVVVVIYEDGTKYRYPVNAFTIKKSSNTY